MFGIFCTADQFYFLTNWSLHVVPCIHYTQLVLSLPNPLTQLVFHTSDNFRIPMPESKKESYDEFVKVFRSVELFRDFIS